MNSPSDFGFVYVATGTAYLAEAFHSANTLRLHHPGSPICLITDHPSSELGPFTEIRRPVAPVSHSPIDKLLALEAPYARIVFLDTDTHVLGDLSPIFATLDRFDFALVQDVNRGWNYTLPGLPETFAEFNTGVVAFRRTEAVSAFFREWRENFLRLRDTLAAQGQPPAADQPAFRYTLYHSTLRVAPLPNEFHFLSDYPNATMWKVRLLHGRGDYDRAAHQINASPGLRSYLPELGAFPAHSGRRRLLIDLLRFNFRALRVLILGAVDPETRHPWKWWQENRSRPPGKSSHP